MADLLHFSPLVAALASIPPAYWRQSASSESIPPTEQGVQSMQQTVSPVKVTTARNSVTGGERAMKSAQSLTVRMVGERMRQARELANLSQIQAARLLGYSNPSKLSKIEGASDTNSVPLWVIARAAALYEVSVDFLFGLSSDWEGSARATQERRVSAWLLGEFTRQQEAGMAVIRSLNDQVEKLAALLPGLHAGALEVNRRLARCRELNPAGYQDMRGGSSLEKAVDELMDRAHQANDAYQRFAGHLRLMERSQGDLKEVAHG